MAYLRWLKSKIPYWHDQGVINLAGSGIQSGDGILLKLMNAHRDRFEALLKRDYDSHYGHHEFLHQVRARHRLPADIGVLPAYGASSALSLVFHAMLRRDALGRVLVESPAYDPLVQIPQFLGAAVDRLPRHRERRYEIDLHELASNISTHTRLIVLTNLHNPSGQALSAEFLRNLAEAVAEQNPQTRILVDETFAGFLGTEYSTAATLGPQFISLGSLTKVYGLGSIRAGSIIASSETFEAIKETWVQMQNIGSRFTESLASLALEHSGEFETHWRAIVKENRPVVEAKLAQVADQLEYEVPMHGCICFPRLRNRDVDAFLAAAESQHKVGLAPGHFFDAPSHFRLGYGGDKAMLEEGLDRLVKSIEST